jgi:hypothetical protein
MIHFLPMGGRRIDLRQELTEKRLRNVCRAGEVRRKVAGADAVQPVNVRHLLAL